MDEDSDDDFEYGEVAVDRCGCTAHSSLANAPFRQLWVTWVSLCGSGDELQEEVDEDLETALESIKRKIKPGFQSLNMGLRSRI